MKSKQVANPVKIRIRLVDIFIIKKKLVKGLVICWFMVIIKIYDNYIILNFKHVISNHITN